jgi:hypothetical protein
MNIPRSHKATRFPAPTRHRRRRARLPPRRPGHPPHAPDPAHLQHEEMADRHHLRHHQPDRQPGHRRPARRMDPRPLADRSHPPHPRRHLWRRRLPGAHRQRAPGDGHPPESGHRHLQARRHHKHRRRLPQPRPGCHPRASRARPQRAMTETGITPPCPDPGLMA